MPLGACGIFMCRSAMQLEHPLPCVSHRAFAGITAGDVGELPFEGARSQNIENNPMQSSRRPPAFEKAS
jgi:hypothetical protein